MLILLIFAILYVIYRLIFSSTINVSIVPITSSIKADGINLHNGTNRVKPGKYKIAISYQGFTPETKEISIKKWETTDLQLILVPEKGFDSLKWYVDHPEDQRKAEEITAKKMKIAKEKVEESELSNLLELLPYASGGEGYKLMIDYKVDLETSKITIIISANSQIGNDEALQWITNNGYDTSKLDIEYNILNF